MYHGGEAMAGSLERCKVLVVDCQSTGANPEQGSLLEIGWTIVSAETGREPSDVVSRLVALPEGSKIPPAVARITGIRNKDLAQAVPAQHVWEELEQVTERVAASSGVPLAPTVIHFARFETPFLRALADDHGGDFGFDIVCSHEIARRILPSLPRRGLRAVAGYFGFPVEQLRRSAGHVAATCWVWSHLVAALENDHGVRTLEQLRDWLDASPPPPTAARVYPMPRADRLALSDAPGVYRMLRSNGDVLYVGKARSLKKRVNSYFQKQRRIHERTLEMLSQARDLDVTVTESALEAALLESDEIKKHAPPYNVALVEGERKTWFGTGDLDGFETTPSGRHWMGPTRSRGAMAPLGELARLVEQGSAAISERAPSAILGLSPARAPDIECFRAGYEAFEAGLRAAVPLRERRPVQSLLRFGAELWRATLEHPPADDGEEPEQAEETEWDPQLVETALSELVAELARLDRRARWLCRLSESAVAWTEEASSSRRVLVVSGGAVVQRDVLEAGKDLPPVPGASRRHAERQRCVDVAAYDRLRVLTSEARRVLAEGGEVHVRFAAGVCLGPDALSRALRWV